MAVPPFTEESARKKVKTAQALWNTKDPQKVVQAYTPTSIWRNRSTFLHGHEDIVSFLAKKWQREQHYILRKELFAFSDNRIAVQFWYEYKDDADDGKWKRCYGIEHWTFEKSGKMSKRMMSGNDLILDEGERWFKVGVDVDSVAIGEEHW